MATHLVKIRRDPLYEEIMRGTLMCPPRHYPYRSEWTEHLNRTFKRDDLFILNSRVPVPQGLLLHPIWIERFSLAVWTVRPRIYGISTAVCTELTTLMAPPDWLPRSLLPTKERVRELLKPGHEIAAMILAAQKAKHRAEGSLKDRSQQQAKDVAKHMRRQGEDSVAYALEAGLIPYVGDEEGGEDLQSMRKDLIEMSKEE